MDINYYKKHEPIDGKWYITKELGSGAFGKVFEIERRDFTNDKSALKIITIPSSANEVRTYREENYDLDEKSVSSYFYGFVEEFTKEFGLMTQLKGQNNIVRIEDYDVKEHEGEVGWDIFIRMELLTPMNKHFAANAPKTRDVIKLGIDICKALEVCQKFNIVHRDIKPSNIFVSDAGDFKLGDFGVARTLEKTSSGLSKKGTYTYMAPEAYKGEAYGSNVDIYSLGIVMYKLLNNNMEPFKHGRTHEDEEKALTARMRGEMMSKPVNAEGRLAEIILKACAFNPKDRYESPLQMREELENILYSENEEKIIYPEGEELGFEPSIIPEAEEPVTRGIFDETPIVNVNNDEDELTRGIFDEQNEINLKKEEIESVADEAIEDSKEPMAMWKVALLVIFGFLLLGCMLYGIFGGVGDNSNDEESDIAWLESYYISDTPLRILDNDYAVEEYAISFAKENTFLKNNVEMAMNEIENNGIKKAIIDKYLLGLEHDYVFQDYAEAKPELRVAVNASYPPYEYYDGENIVGIDIEIAKAIADQLGMKLVIVDMGFDEILTSVQTGKVDMGMGGMTITEHRLESINFSEPYVTNAQSILVREDSDITTIDDVFNGYLLGVQSGTAGSVFADSDFEPNIVNYYGTSQDAVVELVNGRIDFVILDRDVANAYIAANNNVSAYGYTYYPSDWSEENIELGNWFVPYKELNQPIYNCTSLGVELLISDVLDGNPYGEWEVYIRSIDGEWGLLGELVYEENAVSVELHTTFDKPASIDAIAASRCSSESSNHDYDLNIIEYDVE